MSLTPKMEDSSVIVVEEEKPVNDGFTEWKNKCTYKCGICAAKYSAYNSFASHLMGKHYLSMRQYREQNRKSYFVKQVFHKCLICKRKFRHDSTNLTNHTSQYHKMTLYSYYLHHVLQQSGPVDTSELESGWKKSRNAEIEETEAFKSWVNQCVYKCEPCDDEFSCYSHLRFHLATKHMMTLMEYRAQCKSICSKEVFHQCLLCSKLVGHERSRIYSHLKLVHDGLSVADYFVNYVSKSEDSTVGVVPPELPEEPQKCYLCSGLMLSKLSMYAHLRQHHDMTSKEYRKMFGSFGTNPSCFTCKVCLAQIPHNLPNMTEHLSWHGLSMEQYNEQYNRPSADSSGKGNVNKEEAAMQKAMKRWLNQGKYDCEACDVQCVDLAQINSHLKRKHFNITYKEFREQYKSVGKELVFHQCLLCPKKVRHNRIHIGGHIERRHKSNLVYYYKNFVAKHKQGGLKCKICQAKCSGDKLLNMHVNKCHDITIKEYETQVESSETIPSCFLCKLCQAQIPFSETNIAEHLNGHGLSMKEYYEQYEADIEQEKQMPSGDKPMKIKQEIPDVSHK